MKKHPAIDLVKNLVGIDANEGVRNQWLRETLSRFPTGARLLDGGAAELRNRPLCNHLLYVSQDICQYEGKGESQGIQTGTWDTSKIDSVCDITNIPEEDSSFDATLCSEVFEHLPDPLKAVKEYSRLLKPGGILILTAPFASMVHFAHYHYVTGFSRYWYEYHLPLWQFEFQELTPNGDWFSYVKQEILRLHRMARRYGDWCWPLSYLVAGVAVLYFSIRGKSRTADDIGCFGWHCVAAKIKPR